MMSIPIEIVMKIKSFRRIEEVLNKFKEIKKANPNEVIKMTIEIDLVD